MRGNLAAFVGGSDRALFVCPSESESSLLLTFLGTQTMSPIADTLVNSR